MSKEPPLCYQLGKRTVYKLNIIKLIPAPPSQKFISYVNSLNGMMNTNGFAEKMRSNWHRAVLPLVLDTDGERGGMKKVVARESV